MCIAEAAATGVYACIAHMHTQAATKVQAGLRGSHARQELHLQTLQPFRRLSERDD